MNISSLDKNMQIETNISRPGLQYINAESEPFRTYGVFREYGFYARIPSKVAGVMKKQLTEEERAREIHRSSTAGGRIRFVTDSPYVAINAKLDGIYQYTTMSITGTCGFDIYADGWCAGAFRPPVDLKDGYFESVVDLGVSKKREITIDMPLYCNVVELYIGLDETCSVSRAPDYKYEKPIVFYGSSITHGACASRPGMNYPAQLSRLLNTNFHNLGFGGCAKAELEMAEYVASLDMSIFVYDYDHNAPTPEYLSQTHERMFKIVRAAHPDLPIIMITCPRNDLSGKWGERREIIKRTYDNAVARGDKNVYIIYGTELFPELGSEFSVDGTHPTDLGFYFMANRIAPVIREILEKD